MGKVTDYLIKQVEKQVADRGIVVWYDPEKVYAKLLDTLQIPQTTLIRYEDSFFRLREKLEPYLEYIDQQGLPKQDCETPLRLIVYIPLHRSDTRSALAEAECAGAVIEPGAEVAERNTGLRIIAEQVFGAIRPDKAGEIAKKIDEGVYTIEELDKLAEYQIAGKIEALVTIYETQNTDEIILSFLGVDDKDKLIQSKKAVSEMRSLFISDAGLDIRQTDSPSALRHEARRALLMAEFLIGIPTNKLPGALSAIPVPHEKAHLEQVLRLCKSWRNRNDLRDSYRQAALDVEREMGLMALDIPTEYLLHNETFSAIEKKLILHAEKLILEGHYTETQDLAEKRKTSFWSTESPADGLRWSLLFLASRILSESKRIMAELKERNHDAASLIAMYAGEEHAWYRLDTAYRDFECLYARCEVELGSEHDQMEKVVINVRQEYTVTVQACIEKLTERVAKEGCAWGNILSQDKIFNTHVAPFLEQGAKIAYILVDSLRYEMGKEMVRGLLGDFETTVIPAIAKLPTITDVGMAALLPQGAQGLKIASSTAIKFAVAVGGTALKDRSSRIQYLRDKIGPDLPVCKLNDLIKPSKKQKEEIKQARCVVVTSQEIDLWGEEEDVGPEMREYMDQVIDKLRSAIRRLASLGITTIVVAADHGHLFGESIEGGMKMDAPGGNTLKISRRVWIGKGGAAGEGYIRLKAREIGLTGDMEFAFPRSLACFKAKGASTAYLHGGISLQELVIPLIILKAKEAKPEEIKAGKVHFDMSKSEITTRFFSITLRYSLQDLYGPDSLRVKVAVKAGKKEVGMPATAAYGFEESTREIILEKEKPNPVTIMLTEVEGVSSVTVSVIDAASRIELGCRKDVPVKISI